MVSLRSEKTSDRILALILIGLGVCFRIAPHPDNFTPTMSIALFSGVILPPPMALTVPLLVMMASDLVIGLHSLYWLVWGSFLLVVWIGIALGKRPDFGRVLIGALAGSVLFFVLTNLGVFLFDRMYPKSWAGLVECFTMAIPFFRNTLSGDLFYTFSFFGLFAAAQWMRQPKKIS